MDPWDIDFALLPKVLITDFTCEIDDADGELNTVKFTYQFADRRTWLQTDYLTVDHERIFTEQYDPTFNWWLILYTYQLYARCSKLVTQWTSSCGRNQERSRNGKTASRYATISTKEHGRSNCSTADKSGSCEMCVCTRLMDYLYFYDFFASQTFLFDEKRLPLHLVIQCFIVTIDKERKVT